MKPSIFKKRFYSFTTKLFCCLCLVSNFNFEVYGQNYQFLLNNSGVSDPNTNYTLNAGLTRHIYDSIHTADTSIYDYLPGEKAFERYKFVMQDRMYANYTHLVEMFLQPPKWVMN
ncbi:MAG: hypothetical protein SGJ00_02520, partial [bacterium]|nr:hypothetical protein [bacterium]